jgi:phage-related minor tail protein
VSAAWQVIVPVFCVIITALLSPGIARRAAAKESERQRNVDNERMAQSSTSSRIDRLFTEQDSLRAQLREDNAGLRDEIKGLRDNIRMLEQEVAEWRAGVRGVHGVWVAVPASVWEMVRSRVPELPQTKFPGEADGDLPPLSL